MADGGAIVPATGPLGKRLRFAPVFQAKFRCSSVCAILAQCLRRGTAHTDILKEITNDSTRRKNSVVHRRSKSLRDREVIGVRYRLQTPAARVSGARLSAAGVLLYRRS